MRGATRRRHDPRAKHPRRVVTDMLVVAALKLRDPVLLAVEMKTHDALFHGPLVAVGAV
jgi:hypothetical protein